MRQVRHLLEPFCPQNDQSIVDEIQQGTHTQGLSPRGLQHSNCF